MSATSSRAKTLRSVIPATLREGPFVREIGLSGEHARRFAGPGYAIALEIANVRRESCRPRPAVTHDARFDDDASGRIEEAQHEATGRPRMRPLIQVLIVAARRRCGRGQNTRSWAARLSGFAIYILRSGLRSGLRQRSLCSASRGCGYGPTVRASHRR